MYSRIRQAHRDGMSIRAIARTFHHSRRKVREVLANPQPKPFTRLGQAPATKLGDFHHLIQQLLADDEQAPPKQRHTFRRVFERLRDEHGYLGGYDAVRRYVGKVRRQHVETFIPLTRDAGQRLEADFGHIYVDFPQGRQQIPVLMLVWSHSDCPFAMAMPSERAEAILEGMVQGLEFFGCVPREVWWDNPKTVAAAIFSGRQRQLHARYQALASHYVFEPLFCMPARGNEKPYVENRVKTLQRRWATPVPHAKDLSELNAYLRDCCGKDRARTSGENTETIGQRFERDRQQAFALPSVRFDACIYEPAKIDKYQTARFDQVRYSVPQCHAFQTATVKAYTQRIEIVVAGQVIARHSRSYAHGTQVLEPLHYLPTLQRRPAALDHADVFRQWKLPAIFQELRERLETRHGPLAGRRHYARVLELLAVHPLPRVQQALVRSQGFDGLDAEVIAQRTRQLALHEHIAQTPANVSDHAHQALRVQVPEPTLDHFNQFLSQGDSRDECESQSPVARQPEGPASADDAGRARQAGPRGSRQQSDLRGVPAATDGVGTGGALGQCHERTHQECRVPRAEGAGQLRLLGAAATQQTKNPGASALRLDPPALQLLFGRQRWYGQDAPGDQFGFGCVS
jgi:transposase